MKNLLKVFIVLFFIALIVAVVSFCMMKKADKGEENGENSVESVESAVSFAENVDDASEGDQEDYSLKLETAAEKLQFLKLKTVDEVTKYADESEIYIMSSDDEKQFGIGELYVEEIPIFVFYTCNEDKSVKLISGQFAVELEKLDDAAISSVTDFVDGVIALLFDYYEFEHEVFSEMGYSLQAYSQEAKLALLSGEGTYFVSAIDTDDTYWKIQGKVVDQKQFKFEFQHHFDTSAISDGDPTIDLGWEAGADIAGD